MSPTQTSDFAVGLVGTGAVRANPRRGGPCQVLELGSERILVDCGRSAVAGLHRYGYLVEDINTVFVTHLHFDHVCDLPYFVLLSWNNGRRERLRLFGPPGLESFLDHAVSRAYELDIRSRLGHGKDPLGIEWKVTEVTADGGFAEVEGCELSALRTPHAGMCNLNLRVSTPRGSMGVTSDTVPDDSLVGFYREATLLVSECSGTREFLQSVPWGGWHMWPERLGEICESASVAHVVLKHLVIEDWSEDRGISEEMARIVRRSFGGRVTVGYDGLRISI